MKKPLLLILALGLVLSGCGGHREPAETSEGPGLLLVESRPPVTVPETTDRAETLPPFLQPTREESTQPETTQPTAAPETEAPKPVITKSPTGETAEAGGEAWFVAHGEDAEGVRWWFTPAGEETPKSARDTKALFPDLGIQGDQEDTLILTGLPPELSGWTLKAEYYGPGGSSFTEPALLTVEPVPGQVFTGDLPRAYETVLQNCRYVQSFDPDRDSMEALGQQDLYQLYDGRELLGAGLGYALQDLDRDGIPELILGCPGDNGFGPQGGDMVFALFTARGDSPVKLLQSWARNRHYLTDQGLLYRESSGGAASSDFTVLKLTGTALTPSQVLWTDGADSLGNALTYYSPTGEKVTGDSARIPEARFYEIQSQLLSRKAPLPPLTPIF